MPRLVFSCTRRRLGHAHHCDAAARAPKVCPEGGDPLGQFAHQCRDRLRLDEVGVPSQSAPHHVNGGGHHAQGPPSPAARSRACRGRRSCRDSACETQARSCRTQRAQRSHRIQGGAPRGTQRRVAPVEARQPLDRRCVRLEAKVAHGADHRAAPERRAATSRRRSPPPQGPSAAGRVRSGSAPASRRARRHAPSGPAPRSANASCRRSPRHARWPFAPVHQRQDGRKRRVQPEARASWRAASKTSASSARTRIVGLARWYSSNPMGTSASLIGATAQEDDHQRAVVAALRVEQVVTGDVHRWCVQCHWNAGAASASAMAPSPSPMALPRSTSVA